MSRRRPRGFPPFFGPLVGVCRFCTNAEGNLSRADHRWILSRVVYSVVDQILDYLVVLAMLAEEEYALVAMQLAVLVLAGWKTSYFMKSAFGNIQRGKAAAAVAQAKGDGQADDDATCGQADGPDDEGEARAPAQAGHRRDERGEDEDERFRRDRRGVLCACAEEAEEKGDDESDTSSIVELNHAPSAPTTATAQGAPDGATARAGSVQAGSAEAGSAQAGSAEAIAAQPAAACSEADRHGEVSHRAPPAEEGGGEVLRVAAPLFSQTAVPSDASASSAAAAAAGAPAGIVEQKTLRDSKRASSAAAAEKSYLAFASVAGATTVKELHRKASRNCSKSSHQGHSTSPSLSPEKATDGACSGMTSSTGSGTATPRRYGAPRTELDGPLQAAQAASQRARRSSLPVASNQLLEQQDAVRQEQQQSAVLQQQHNLLLQQQNAMLQQQNAMLQQQLQLMQHAAGLSPGTSAGASAGTLLGVLPLGPSPGSSAGVSAFATAPGAAAVVPPLGLQQLQQQTADCRLLKDATVRLALQEQVRKTAASAPLSQPLNTVNLWGEHTFLSILLSPRELLYGILEVEKMRAIWKIVMSHSSSQSGASSSGHEVQYSDKSSEAWATFAAGELARGLFVTMPQTYIQTYLALVLFFGHRQHSDENFLGRWAVSERVVVMLSIVSSVLTAAFASYTYEVCQLTKNGLEAPSFSEAWRSTVRRMRRVARDVSAQSSARSLAQVLPATSPREPTPSAGEGDTADPEHCVDHDDRGSIDGRLGLDDGGSCSVALRPSGARAGLALALCRPLDLLPLGLLMLLTKTLEVSARGKEKQKKRKTKTRWRYPPASSASPSSCFSAGCPCGRNWPSSWPPRAASSSGLRRASSSCSAATGSTRARRPC
ncbi:unnamed protein product [Prorocentrum cordatum]|uniref:Uncharacterized protein n=1 Tax=Prorocentrum cordatum TaxID=2364126 RepID=A0ABN9WZA7_9DINO|nr:unnamed protein product [Polarella glacialis]